MPPPAIATGCPVDTGGERFSAARCAEYVPKFYGALSATPNPVEPAADGQATGGGDPLPLCRHGDGGSQGELRREPLRQASAVSPPYGLTDYQSAARASERPYPRFRIGLFAARVVNPLPG